MGGMCYQSDRMDRPLVIAVGGIVGVGKTTLAGQLSGILSLELVCEEYDRNPFLARQLAGDHDAALASELFFLLSRARQLDGEAVAGGGGIVCDYVFAKNRIFAELALDEHQLGIFAEIERIVLGQIARPDVVVYLRDTVDNCLERIRERGRAMEAHISAGWLERLARGYDGLFERWTLCPVVTVEARLHDFRQVGQARRIAEQVAVHVGSSGIVGTVAGSDGE